MELCDHLSAFERLVDLKDARLIFAGNAGNPDAAPLDERTGQTRKDLLALRLLNWHWPGRPHNPIIVF